MNETFGGKQQLFIERLKNKYQLYCIIVTSCFHDDKGVRFVLFCCCFFTWFVVCEHKHTRRNIHVARIAQQILAKCSNSRSPTSRTLPSFFFFSFSSGPVGKSLWVSSVGPSPPKSVFSLQKHHSHTHTFTRTHTQTITDDNGVRKKKVSLSWYWRSKSVRHVHATIFLKKQKKKQKNPTVIA